jgi:glucose-1-phosphate thymidylyltransferase
MKKERKGIILAGGSGTRLRPLTNVISKQLLPIYNKPMIYYPLSILININIKEILIISDANNLPLYKKLIGNGDQFGVKIFYKTQKSANGVAAAYILGKKFLKNSPSVLILGDNIFYGSNLLGLFKKANYSKNSSIFTYEVDNPGQYGVLFQEKKSKYIIEKPNNPKSKKAVVGIYFLDSNASRYAEKLKPSKRKELEITDLNNLYLKKKKTNIINLKKGTVWLDTGSFEGLLNANNFVKTIEDRQGIDIAPLKNLTNSKF